MPIHLMRELESLKRNILTMGAMVEEAIAKSIQALADRDRVLAEEVRTHDARVNQTEIEIEEECLRLLALQQPVAMDLRFIVSVFKINNDLERIGDVAANIARRAAALADGPHTRLPAGADFTPMAQHAQKMLRQALDALVNGDNKLAMAVCLEDEWMDEANRRMQSAIEDTMRMRPEAVNHLAQLLSVSRHLERIADLSTNIAEDVIYMLEGIIVRHRFEDYRRQQEMRVGHGDETGVLRDCERM